MPLNAKLIAKKYKIKFTKKKCFEVIIITFETGVLVL